MLRRIRNSFLIGLVITLVLLMNPLTGTLFYEVFLYPIEVWTSVPMDTGTGSFIFVPTVYALVVSWVFFSLIIYVIMSIFAAKEEGVTR